MSLQGPLLVVADAPATAPIEALSAAGAFPIVETTWADAPTAFVSVKPAAVVIAEPGAPKSEASGRMLALQIATSQGAIVPIVAMADAEHGAAIPTALTADADQPIDRLVGRLRTALRVRALHSSVLRRIETFAAQGGTMPALPVGDPLDDATVLVAGRGPLYPALAVAMGEHAKMVGALSVEAAAKHLEERDIDGIIIGDSRWAATNGDSSKFGCPCWANFRMDSPAICPTSNASMGRRIGWYRAWCRGCGYTPLNPASSACCTRSTPTACSIRKRAC